MTFIEERLGKAENGDYLVFSGKKMLMLIRVHAISPRSIIFEEITAPEEKVKIKDGNWPAWVQAMAPGHSSWSMIEIDRTTGEILECYSFSRGAWLQVSSQESLIATLLKLPLQEVPSADQRRIGPAPLDGERDYRKIWQPPATIAGKKESLQFDVFKTLWPKDGTELAGQTLLLYFDQKSEFPLPFWIQVETTHLNISFRAIDAGKSLKSPYKTFPRRIPQFIGQAKKNGEGLSLKLQSPKYYQNFELYVVDVTTKEKEICPIDFQTLQREGELYTLEVLNEALEATLKPGHEYTWLIVPEGHAESYAQTTKTFTF